MNDRCQPAPSAKVKSAFVDWVILCAFELLVDSVRLVILTKVFAIDKLTCRTNDSPKPNVFPIELGVA